MDNEKYDIAQAELNDRREERQLRSRELELNFEYASFVAKQQSNDNQDYREKSLKLTKHILYIGLTIVLAFLFFFGVALTEGFTSFVTQTLQTLIVGIFGWLGGYGYAKHKHARPIVNNE